MTLGRLGNFYPKHLLLLEFHIRLIIISWVDECHLGRRILHEVFTCAVERSCLFVRALKKLQIEITFNRVQHAGVILRRGWLSHVGHNRYLQLLESKLHMTCRMLNRSRSTHLSTQIRANLLTTSSSFE